jgi:hypothetical protein
MPCKPSIAHAPDRKTPAPNTAEGATAAALLTVQQPAVRHLDQTELARRWRMSARTLERWRWLKIGPPYLKIGGRIVYSVDDIEAFEKAQRRTPSQ